MYVPPTNENERGLTAHQPTPNDQHPTKVTDPLSSSTIAKLAAALPSDVLAALVELLPDPSAEIELRRRLCREAARDAYQRGYYDGYERGARILEAEWPTVVKGLDGPTHEELETLRYGPGRREHFGDPRPGDRFHRIPLEAAL